MTIAPYTYDSLVSCSDPSFDEFYSIYEGSLPLRERKSKAQISAVISRPDYKTLLLKRNDVVIGFSMLFIATEESFCLLEYMAIHPVYRNSGLGRELFLHTFQNVVVSDHGASYGLLEVDSDREQSEDQEMRRRRQRFYRRLGCFRIDRLSYLLPLPGEGPPPQMNIMVYPPDRFLTISKHQLKQWLKVIYNKVYDCCPDDPRITKMMKYIGDPVKLL
ncbi:MAG: GNAT family N-acetyltransferase [Proteobacteria bacterium]|nr:GNAT family N-acetyltransferase [Pseudomonadota bacterium]MBU1456487.1 GNAT family N-acetyltransferase [Pseudomonadota bacterium]